MRRVLQTLDRLRAYLLEMGSLVESQMDAAMRALTERDEARIQMVMDLEERVNSLEIELEEGVIRFLALFQPEAEHLRTSIMIMKISNDLERVGDHAVNIAQAAAYLLPLPPVKPLVDIPRMASIAREMLTGALDAFVHADAEQARVILKRDDEVDALRDQVVRELITYMVADPRTVDRSLKLIQVSKDLERIADLATNVAEDVVYMVEARVVKHHFEESGEERHAAEPEPQQEDEDASDR
ncbi:MAG: phosphate signaling complex protein PhoU [Candidatus Hydrothermae bacterium]|nr:phosphate signaling complex protein PhoU [Candidatus Hydrothermae bacterium]